MVAEMAMWLVTPSGFKRPMTRGELQQIAYTAPSDWLEGLVKAYVGDGIGRCPARMPGRSQLWRTVGACRRDLVDLHQAWRPRLHGLRVNG